MAKLSLLIPKFEIGFPSIILVIQGWEMNKDKNAHHTSIKIL